MWEDTLARAIYPDYSYADLKDLNTRLLAAENLKVVRLSVAMNDLYFFRNSNGVEVDIIQKKDNGLELYESMSGKALDKDYRKDMKSFCNKFGACPSSIIYSGASYPAFNGSAFYDFHEIYPLFEKKDEVFRLDF